MTRTIYTLLVGIDNYPPGVNPLHGCVNDIRRVEQLLKARVTSADDHWSPLVLTDEAATRGALIAGFRTHLAQAKAGDVALFYYSGHGSQSHSPQEFWHLEPDRLDETLVCYDSRLPGGWDLADKELAQLISEVAATDAHVAVILDCCHSGSGTRDLLEEGVSVRRVPTDERIRPVESFLVDAAQAAALSRGGNTTAGGWYSLPKGRHVVLSACNAEELAKELRLGGEQRGAFSYFLLESLEQGGNGLTYRDLFKRVNALVRARVSAQSPQMEATEGDDLSQPFLGGAITPTPAYYTLRHDKTRGWVIDGGAVHGLPAPAGDETTNLAIFAFNTDVTDLQTLEKAIGTAQVTKLLPTESQVAPTLLAGELDVATTYKALVTALPLTKLIVTLHGDENALTLVRTALTHAGPDGGASLLVAEGSMEEADLTLTAAADRYRIGRRGDGYALVVDTPGFDAGSAQLVVQRLEHIARWYKIVELANSASKLGAQDVTLAVLLPDQAGRWQIAPATHEVRLNYYFADGAWQQPTFKVKLTNHAKRRLYCMLFDLPETYGVFPTLAGAGVWLDPGQEVWANNGDPIYAELPDDLWQAGVVEFKDTLKLIVSTDEGDATLLEQADLPLTVTKAVAGGDREIGLLNTLNRLMHRVHTRHFSSKPANAEQFADWITTEVSFTTVRPLEATAVGPVGTQAKVAPTVTIHGHAKLAARARLTTLPDATRDLGSTPLPALLRDNGELFAPLALSPSRGGEAGLSVLELVDVVDYTVVTPDDPLVVALDVGLQADEALLPLGYDGEFYLPLGGFRRTAGGVEVTLDRLPAPNGTRDLKGSVKILFQKLVGQHLGWEYTYPQLAIARIDQGEPVGYNKDPNAVKKAVQKAKRVLLYVHGIIGDTRGMAASAFPAFKTPPLAVAGLGDRYDLVLTFDYENFHTTIEENARLLKARLVAAGLGPEHGKTLHIVAHSMGGLVSRWFIEREGGDKVVDQLVMVGTPNNGSPWPTVEDYAITALSIGFNSLAKVAWPASVVSMLVKGLEKVDNALDQMNPGSDFLKNLADSPKPNVPYSIIAGNTSLITAALAEDEHGTTIFSRLWARIKPKPWLHTLTAPIFFGQPNDIAVTVESVCAAPMGDQAIVVACDHTTYFNTVAGLEQLAKLLPLEA